MVIKHSSARCGLRVPYYCFVFHPPLLFYYIAMWQDSELIFSLICIIIYTYNYCNLNYLKKFLLFLTIVFFLFLLPITFFSRISHAMMTSSYTFYATGLEYFFRPKCFFYNPTDLFYFINFPNLKTLDICKLRKYTAPSRSLYTLRDISTIYT